jgi:hypothetical protein
MGPLSYMRSVVDRNVVTRGIPCTTSKMWVYFFKFLFMTPGLAYRRRKTGIWSLQDRESFSWLRGAPPAFHSIVTRAQFPVKRTKDCLWTCVPPQPPGFQVTIVECFGRASDVLRTSNLQTTLSKAYDWRSSKAYMGWRKNKHTDWI